MYDAYFFKSELALCQLSLCHVAKVSDLATSGGCLFFKLYTVYVGYCVSSAADSESLYCTSSAVRFYYSKTCI